MPLESVIRDYLRRLRHPRAPDTGKEIIVEAAILPIGEVNALRNPWATGTHYLTALADIKEVEANVILGFNTGTFHIILKSGQTYNFVASSLRPADSQSLIDSLQKAIR